MRLARPRRTDAQLASAFDLLCERLRRQLQPLFGTTAVSALFVRAVHVATVEFPWLRKLVRTTRNRCVSERIASVGELEIETLEEGLAAVLAHNIGLLSAFVGEDSGPASGATGVGRHRRAEEPRVSHERLT